MNDKHFLSVLTLLSSLKRTKTMKSNPFLSKLLLLPAFLLLALTAVAQPATTVYEDALRHFKRGQMFYDLQLYDLSRREMELALTVAQPYSEPDYEQLKLQATIGMAQAAARSGLPESEVTALNFVRDQVPDPAAGQAIYELANYYFNSGDFEQAVTYLDMVDKSGLSPKQRIEIGFKQGYAFFVKKEYAKAKAAFKGIMDNKTQTEYSEHATYYYGNICVNEAKYDEAARSFQKLTASKTYADVIPFNLCQIYFGKKDYDKVISYGRESLRSDKTKFKDEINRLIGQAYFEKKQYVDAAQYLEPASVSGKLTAEDFYQLGFVQYKAGKYKDAIKNFEQLNKTESKMGQSAMFSLADCHLKLGNKQAARNAFANASRMTFDPAIQEDAKINYAKLSYELGYDRECVNTLQQITSKSPYYSESRSLMSRALLNSKDFAQAIDILEELVPTNADLRPTMQKVLVYRALQLHQSGNTGEADRLFAKSLDYPEDPSTKAEATYWQGEIAYHNKQYGRAIELLNSFNSQYKSSMNLSDGVAPASAKYIIGYSNLKEKKYADALTAFADCVSTIKKNGKSTGYIGSEVLPDAVLRAGDCQFKRNKYDEALKYYDEAVTNRYPEFEYALYQKAVILGLRKKPSESLLAFEKLAKDYPNSEYADDALYQTGATYMDIGQLEKASAPLKKLVDNYRGKTTLYNDALLRLGLLSYNQGNTNESIKYYKQVFQNNPEADEAKSALAALEEIYISDLGKPEEYASFLETVPGYKLDNMGRDSLSFRSAQTQFENGNYQRAIEGYTQYLNGYPNGASALQARFNRGESYASLKQWDKALADYEAVADKGASRYYVKALYKAAIIAYNHSQNFDKAFKLYSKLEKEQTDDETKFEAQLGAMRSAYRLKNNAATLEYARKVADNSKATRDQQAIAHFYIGKISYDKKELPTAVTAFRKVTTLTGGEQAAEARYFLAQALYQQKKLDESLVVCEEITDQHGDFPVWIAKSIILQSDIYSDKNDLFNARAALEAVIENFTQDATILQEAKDKLKALEIKENAASRLAPAGAVELDNGN
jgi:TolA-binding protein